MKAAQAATVIEELARVLEVGGAKTGAADFRALAQYLRENAANDLDEAIPVADPSQFSAIYLEALTAAASNRQLFDAVFSVLKADKTIDANSLAGIARSYSEIPTLKTRPKALKAIQDKFETLVQRERKQREIGKLTDS
jgi:hypothetical protein